jgi:AcrR family transcriptional regulator
MTLTNFREDRRTMRTRKALGDALIELMLEKRFEHITVQDILDRANVGRSTFYAHFPDKESLLLSEIEHLLYQLNEHAAAGGQGPGGPLPSLGLFRHVQEQRKLMRAFVSGPGAELLTQGFQRRVRQLIERNLQEWADGDTEPAVPLSVIANFVASTWLMLLRWWFDEGMRRSPEQMDTMFQQLVMPALSNFIEQARFANGH